MTDRLTKALERLSPEQRALLAQRMRRKREAKVEAISRRSGEGPIPASFSQERMWFLEQLEPGSPAYHLASAVWIDGPFDEEILRSSLAQLVERHEALRTTFQTVEGQPVQVVESKPGFDLRTERVSADTAESRTDAARRIFEQEVGQPFDLEQGPLLRLRLISFDDHHHLLVFCLHHIVTDGWSQGVLKRELSALYDGLRQDSNATGLLPELEIQYPDFAVWQRRWLSGERLERQLAYWRDQLRAVPALELPADRARPVVPSYDGGIERLHVPSDWVRSLTATDGASGTTPFMALLAGFAGLLGRLTGQHDFAIGSPIANRRRPGLEGLIGFFLNTLALRSNLFGDLSYRQLLAHVRETSLAAFSHQDLPFEKLVEELSPERHMGRSPLFQVLFAVQNMDLQPPTFAGTETRPLDVGVATTRFDLELYAWERQDDWRLQFVYNADLFEAATIVRWARHYARLLHSALDAPDTPLSRLPLLSPAETHQALIEDSDSARSLFGELTISGRIARRGKETSDAVAVISGDQQVTYRALLTRAEEIADRLRGVGVGAGALVGLCTERGPEMVASLLGVLQSGAAYVPLDPSLPADRLAYMARDAGLAALISERPLAARLPAVAELAESVEEVLWLGESPPQDSLAITEPTPADLAYVIYTSGSTGRPKGVQLSHRGVVNFLDSMAREPGLSEGDTVLAVTTLSFDIAVLELLLPLTVGAKTVIASSEVAADGERLARLLGRSRANVMQATPATWQLLVQLGWSGEAGLKILCGGEALPPRLASELASRGRELWNLYGPTETTVWSATSRIVAEDGPPTITLGRAIANTGLYVLDRRLRPVPRGIPGQLAIAGASLARGYWRRPSLAAGVFCPDPFVAGPFGARLYLTGDLVRRDGAGRLIYFGRLDHQIKLRGFRIELGEIEAALESLPAVERAVVLLHEAAGGDPRLVAFLLHTGEEAISEVEARDALASGLPDYMIPAAFIGVTEWPLTPSGKVDRKALGQRASELRTAVPDGVVDEPRGPVEQAIASAFADVLERQPIGRDESFFALGGHSLLAARMIFRLRESLGVELPLRTVFEAPTVASLASRIETPSPEGKAIDASPAIEAPAVEVVSRDEPLPLSFGQERLWFLEQLEPESLAYRMTSAVWIRGPLDVQALDLSLRELVRRHESLRTTFTASGGVARQTVQEQGRLALELEEALNLPPEDQDRRADEILRATAAPPFDLEHGPLVRARLVTFEEELHLFVLCLHHIVTDGSSQTVLGRELSALYEAFRDDPDSVAASVALPALPVQYPDFAVWQRQWLAGDVLEEQLSFWRQQLEEVPALELPVDRPRPTAPSGVGGIERMQLPEGLVARLASIDAGGTTPFMALLAGFAGLLVRLTGQRDFAIGSPVANRRRPELEHLIGLFINLVALRVDLSGDVSYRRLLARLREVSLAAFHHQDLPFEKLVDELSPERHLDRGPIFQVLFALQNMAPSFFQLAGTESRPAYSRVVPSRFDLELFAFGQGSRDWRLALVYSADLFDATTIRRVARSFVRLLEAAADDLEAPLSSLSLIRDVERHQTLVEPSDAVRPLPRELRIHRRVEHQAVASPDRLAMIGGEHQVTYGALWTRAVDLADRLHRMGVGAGDLVGLCVDRGPEMVASLLAVLESGAAYVPLDPGLPAERLAYMAADAELAAVVSERRLASRLPAVAALTEAVDRVVWLDEEGADALRDSVPRNNSSPEELAYVIYTSGSTGRPKGVQLSHRNVVNFLQAMAQAPGLSAEDTVLAVTTLSFDIAVLELLLPLTVGARAVIASREETADGQHLARLLAGHRVSVLQATPATWQLLIQSGWHGEPGLKMLCGGEALPPRLATELLPRGAELWNVYGPTETTVWSATSRLSGTSAGDQDITLGQPIDNTGLYLLDRRLRPVPTGTPGQLAIAGTGLARGYLRRPVLTAGSFCPNPFLAGVPSKGGQRLYLTGDLVRRDSASRLYYLGRLDHQVKLRGFRIELGEIEEVLCQHPAVAEAVMVLAEDRLVAYIQPDRQQTGVQESEHVDQWQSIWNQSYRGGSEEVDPAFDLSGWASSYSGEPIAPEEMSEWVDRTVDGILRSDPRSILEIGCGTGLLLFRLADRCQHYVGVDISSVVIERLHQRLAQAVPQRAEIELHESSATDLSSLGDETFETVVINSVSQYFPSVEYLLRVLESAAQVLAADGVIFVGDVRDLRSLQTFHAAVQLHQASADLPIAEWRRRVRQATAQEEELILDPAFFVALMEHLPGIEHVEIRPKRGKAHNELTQFRYDVWLYASQPADVTVDRWLDWPATGLSPDEIREHLGNAPGTLGLRGIPNARTTTEAYLVEFLERDPKLETVADLRHVLAEREMIAVDPESVGSWVEDLPYDADLSWMSTDSDGRFDVIFWPREQADTASWPLPQIRRQPWSVYANQPLQAKLGRQLAPQLREHLRAAVPEYMVPAAFVVLQSLPLTPSGKLDRRALPSVEDLNRRPTNAYVAPRTSLEQHLCEIWGEVLGLEQIGIEDHFFELGGHSILATQLVARVHDALGVELPLRELFARPTVREQGEKISRRRGEGALQATPELVALPRDDAFWQVGVPLSFGQERLWFLEQLEPGSVAYHMVSARWIVGTLDAEVLRCSLRALVRRHEALRTTFRAIEGEPVQWIQPEPEFELRCEHLGEGEPESEARRLAAEEVRRPFDLEHGPLLRARLVTFGDDRQLLLIGLHHIVTDGWSQGVLMRELSTLYQAARQDASEAPLPALPIQYPDFAVWQRSWLRGEPLERQLDYWREQLAAVPALELPTDHSRPAVPSYAGGIERLELPGGLLESMTAADGQGDRQGTTPFMVLLTAFASLLSRLTGQRDFAVGSPIAGRRRTELEDLIGLFINTLALRIDLSRDPSYRQLLESVRETSLAAYSHQDVPFEKVVDELSPERHLSRSPLFQVLLAVQNVELQSSTFAGFETRPLAGRVTTTRFDLELYAWQPLDVSKHSAGADRGWQLSFVYNTDLFDASTVHRLAKHFAGLLQEARRAPDTALSRLRWLSRAERHQALVEDSDSAQPLPTELQVHRRIAQHASQTPDAVALIAAGQHLSYGALHTGARALASHLRASGVGPGDLVGLCTERELEMVTSLLAVLESGAAYVPLDPGLPAERLEYMARDAGLAALISQRPLASRLPSVATLATAVDEVLWLEDTDFLAASLSQSSGFEGGRPDDLAYVIYTSGSTGRPKGVQLSHRNVSNFLQAMAREPGLGPEETMLAVTTLSFDIAVLELLLPLTVGARAVIASSEVTADGERLAELLADSRASVMQATPATWQLLVRTGWEGGSRLKVLSGGEALPPRLAGELIGRSGELWNLYGPTETTVWSATSRVRGTAPASTASSTCDAVTLGRPIGNTGLYVLDARFRPVSRGVPGQLAIAGDGLARGYLRRPALTAGVFCPNPFADRGARLYRTGDLARRDADGRLSYLGRFDHQIKLRGFRIELGEIEAALESLTAVDRAIVLLQGTGEAQRLVAFLLSPQEHGENALAESEIRDHLASRLPEYMIPAAFATVQEFPLTPSGKVDRKALNQSAMQLVSAPSRGSELGPSGPTEEAVAAAFAEVLGRETVGANESFFSLGGHSLLAARLIHRLRERLDQELPLRTVFEAPTVAALASRLVDSDDTSLSGAAVEPPPIEKASRDDALPLSFGQERLWFLEQLEPDSPAYRLLSALWIEGPLNVPALERSFQELVRRHESLRTTFSAAEGVAHQVVSSHVGQVLELTEKGAASAEEIFRQEMTRPFDLASGSLLRARLTTFGTDRHLLVICLHHIVTDAWSQGVLGRELSTLYGAFREDVQAPSPLPELAIQYPDFAAWQRQWLAGEVLEQQLTFWRQQLDGVPVLELPADHSRPSTPSYAGGEERLQLSHGLVHQLTTLGSGDGTTPFMALLAGLSGLLFRLTGQQDFAIGSPVAGRSRPELEELIGLFINVVALRADCTGEPSFSSLLGRIRDVSLDAFSHQDLPFEKLVDEISPERHLARSPIFQVLFAVQNVGRTPLTLDGATTRPAPRAAATTRFDLELYAWEPAGQDGWQLSFVYNTDLFTASKVRRIARSFSNLLESSVEAPDTPLSRLSLLSEAERHQALVEDSDSDRTLPVELRIHRQVAQRASQVPDAVAVIGEGQHLSYGALMRRAGELASQLRTAGVGVGDFVGLCTERGPKMVTSLLAVLESGAAYVPLDPGLPTERLEYMAEDAGLAGLISQRSLAARLPSVAALTDAVDQVLWLDAKKPPPPPAASSGEATEGTPDDLAYVIYTSGSTGRPKGVQLSHRNVSNFLTAMAEQPGLGAGDTVLAVTTLSFDIAVLELLLPLTIGARTVIASSEVAADGEHLAELLTAARASVMQATPATWQLLVQIGWQGDSRLKILCGGEALPPRLAHELIGRGGELWNLYGPTETTVWSATSRVHGSTAGSTEAVTLGRPIANTDLYVLDRRLRPVSRGISGQLAIAGTGLARGYLRRPALTAGVFCPDPFVLPGNRLYLTGDLVRRDADGRLSYLGRLDHQIKLRGFRIELGEIEAALESLPAVERAVVLLQGTGEASRLVAFLLSSRAVEPSVPAESEMREHLASRLPDYMIPAAFVAVQEFPLTPSGKVDRKALNQKAQELVAVPTAGAEVAPRGPVEEAVASAFAEVLGRESVGATDSFFTLGGHSLLAARLIHRLHDRLGADLPLRAVFEAPTVAALALRLSTEDDETSRAALVEPPPIEKASRDADLPLSFGQERLWFLEQLEPNSPAYRLLSALWIEGPLDVPALERSFQELVRRHESLRTTFTASGGVARQIVSAEIASVLERVEEGSAATDEIVSREMTRPFNLEQGPLLRARLVATDSDRHLLVLCLHHIVTDAWSQGLLGRELSALYAAFREDPEASSPLPEPAIQYPDFAVWQRQWLAGEVLEHQLAFWRQQLDGVPALELPSDFPRPSTPSYAGGEERVQLSQDLVHRLTRLGGEESTTPFMVLLAGFAGLLFRLTGQRDFAIGSPVAGRRRPELEKLIGLFINVVALRADCSGEPSFRSLLGGTRDVSLDAFSHQDLPFEKLVDELSPERHQARSPIFQVLFALQNVERGPLTLAGTRTRPTTRSTTTTRFDLELYAWEMAGGQGWQLSFVYNADLFTGTKVRRMARALVSLLEAALEAPETPLRRLSLMSPAERHQALVEDSDSVRSLPAELRVHRRIAQRAVQMPDAVALIGEDLHLSYHGLLARSGELASHLNTVGVGAGARVGLCTERGPEMVASLLAVLESGAAYVPLDPNLPAERLEYMAEDAGLAALISQRPLAARMSSVAALSESVGEVLWLDEKSPVGAVTHEGKPDSGIPDDLAYVIYTSGSTGRPKGVQLTHRNVSNFLNAMARQPGLGPNDTVLAVTTLSFDIAVLELLLPLTVGARAVIASSEEAADGERLAGLLTDARANVMQATPATWQLLVQIGWRGDSRFKMLCGGEALPPRLASELIGRGGELWNLYGPTETTVWSATSQVRGTPAGTADAVTLGRPIGNTGLYVLDRSLRPVSRGIPGQLAIAGAGLARGYLRRPALTAGVFCPDPYSQRGARLYLTGDLVRRDADGRLSYLGRLDHQIKLRGFRIELGEIEAALELLAAVERAVVLLHEVTADDHRLVAFLLSPQADGEGVPPEAEIRDHLASRLPEYMIPSAYLTVAEYPLTPSGKVDRKALVRSVPDLSKARQVADHQAPRGPIEEAVAAAFGEVLGRDVIGAQDHFFDAGGHSLLATQLLSRVRDVFRVDLPLTTLFDHPTVEALAQQVEQARRGAASESPVSIAPVPRDQGVPRDTELLSLAQRRLWFLDQLGAGPAYNIKLAFALDGELDAGALIESLQQITRRHETLRASFPQVDGEPRQQIAPSAWLPTAEVDLAALKERRRHRELTALALELESTAFDLSQGPLMRALLVRLGDVTSQGLENQTERHVLVIAVHHIVFDGWSTNVFRRELMSHYSTITTGAPPLPAIEVQYLDYVAWQQERMTPRVLEGELAFWKEQLRNEAGGPLPVVELPTDRPRPPVQGYRGDSRPFWLPHTLSYALADLSQQLGVTPAMLLLAGFKALLVRKTGQRDLIVGSPIAQRLRSELELLIGFFANTIVLRTDLSAPGRGLSFRECVGRVQRVSLAAYDHQEMPFDLLVEELETDRDPSRNPVFQIAFAFQHVVPQTVENPGLAVRWQPLGTSVARMDLELFLLQGLHGLSGRLVYNADLFDGATIDRFVGHLQCLLESAVADPEAPIGDLELLGSAERHQLRFEWNATDQAYEEAGVHELIAARVHAAPEKVAVVFEDSPHCHQYLTFGALDARAARLAHALRDLGVDAEDRVALCVERGVDMIVAILGIWKAGGAYVPLDPDYPSDRLAFMLRDCRVRVLLTQETLLEGLPETDVQVLCFDRDRERIASAPAEEPRAGSTAGGTPIADRLAYVIYTSGSTGTPKGALLAHRGLASLAAEQVRTFGTGPQSRVLQFSSLSFDASTFEIVMGLTGGATLAFGRRQEVMPGPDLLAFLERQRISIVLLPPAALAPLPEAPLPALRTITAGGEALPPELPARWAPGRRFFNLYGPTEATIVSTMTEVTADHSPPIGRPIANTQGYVLDRGRRPVATGVAGELLVSGVSLARGYLGRPALTAERFVPMPALGKANADAAQLPGARLYRTGDLVRHLTSGKIEYLGRIDHQVKLRGYRIELGEIEATLETHSAVEQAVALLYEASAHDRRLVVFWVPVDQVAVEEAELRRHLTATLPDYMVPADYLLVAELPLNPSGKIDRAELHRRVRPALDARQYGVAVAAPQGNHELQLVSLWEQVLQRNPIGVNSNFFDLGGSSLLAIRLFALIEQTFGQTLPISTLFRAPTIEQLAEVLRQEGFESRFSSVVPIHPWGDRPPLFCAHGETGDPFIYRHLAQHLGTDQPLYGLLSRGLDQQTPPFTQMEEMAAHYLNEMRQIQPHGPYFLGGFCFGGIAASEIARQLMAEGEEVALLAAFDAPAPISDALPRSVLRRYRRFWLRKRLERQLDVLRPLPASEKVDFLARWASRLLSKATAKLRRRPRPTPNSNGSQPPPVVRANRRAAHHYRPDFYPGQVTVFRSVGSLGEVFLDPFLGWRVLAQDRVELREIPGSHHSMFDEPNVQVLATELRQCLDAASGNSPDVDKNLVKRSK